MNGISIIIPVRNNEDVLGECLYSVLNQSLLDYEVIVVDNDSVDKTKAIILSFMEKDKRVRYVYAPCASRGRARRAGVEVSCGEIIVMTDADCVVPYQWVEELTAPMIKGKECVVMGNEQDLIRNYWTFMQQEGSQEFLGQHVYETHYINHLDTKNFAIRKECLDKAGGFNPNVANFEDFELKIRLRKKGYKIYFLESLSVGHRHPDSLIKMFIKKMDQGFWLTHIYKMHKMFLKEYSEEMIKSINIVNFLAFFPWLFILGFKKGYKKAVYEAISGTAWRLGIIAARAKPMSIL